MENYKEELDNLRKEDLIKVIANMHDTIQEWGNGYGLLTEDAKTLEQVGSACCSFCVETKDFTLPIIKK